MDKVLSTRLDEKVIAELERATQKLGMTKKQFLEEAISLRAKETSTEERLLLVRQSQGAWDREEMVEETLARHRQDRARQFRRHVIPGTDHW